MEQSSVQNSSETTIGEAASISCERCRRRKIKCDRRQPCSRCEKAGTECRRAGTGEKQRPIARSYVHALERQVASLETFITKLAATGDDKRDEMLNSFRGDPAKVPTVPDTPNPEIDFPKESPSDTSSGANPGEKATLARSRVGQIRRQAVSTSSHFYGGTSLFHLYLSADTPAVPFDSGVFMFEGHEKSLEAGHPGPSPNTSIWSPEETQQYFAPSDHDTQRLMASFFKNQYQHSMCVYREFFLRDYDAGGGRYYSDILLFAICSMGALATGDKADLPLSEVFSSQAKALLPLALDSPDLTVLQATLLLGQREISQCRASRGWLYCGMAFRLAHEMGLHLDPNNWDGTSSSEMDRQILRRVYWAVFVADKQLSLYFGRPPALYPYESDVRNTVRIPYPPDWEGLLDAYIAPRTSVTAFEDGIALVGAFIYQAELSKIQHNIITELFENRRNNADNAAVAATIQNLHVSLTKWLANLPGKLYWNQWTVGQVPSAVLYLHIRFHTTMMILHRPPPHLFSDSEVAASEDVEICYQSLQATCRLLRIYSRYYRYEHLPLDFVHTLSTAASIILMKRSFEAVPSTQPETSSSRSLVLVQQAMDAIKDTHPCVREIQDTVKSATRAQALHVPQNDLVTDWGLMDWPIGDGGGDGAEQSPGVMLTDDILGGMMPSNPSFYNTEGLDITL